MAEYSIRRNKEDFLFERANKFIAVSINASSDIQNAVDSSPALRPICCISFSVQELFATQLPMQSMNLAPIPQFCLGLG